MADIVVVGAGLGGLAAAARLSKLGHTVTVCERNGYAGGALNERTGDGFTWDAGPTSTALPAVLRDLFRKSGRPIERYLELELRTPARRHVFEDHSIVDLPTGSRSAQTEAIDAGLGPGRGKKWTEFLDAQADVWEQLRTRVLDVPTGGDLLGSKEVTSALSTRTSLAKLLRKAFQDERLRLLADHRFRLHGSDPRDVPAFAAVENYVERSFGVWGIAGGMAALARALVIRLEERSVDLQLDCEVAALTVADGAVVGVETLAGKAIRADLVITDIDPRAVFLDLLPADQPSPARQVFDAATPAIPVAVTHLGLEGDVPALPDEVVLHGEPLLVVSTTGQAPKGKHAWTVWRRGSAQEDVVLTMARRRIDVRKQVVTRIDRNPIELLHETAGSSYGLAWAGWRAHTQRAAQSHPLPGLYLIGASMHPGPSIPYVAWGAAHVAARIGKA